MEHLEKAYRLSKWEEVTGEFTGIRKEHGSSLATIAGVTVLLPIEMGDILSPHLGQRIAILRTDDPTRPYRFRRIDPDIAKKNELAGAANTGQAREHSAQDHRSEE
jgi:hypothetical protein